MTEIEMSQDGQEQEVTMGKLVEDFKVVMHDAESLLKASAGELGERAREARTRLAASLQSARVKLTLAEERAFAGAKATDRVIREHPYQSLGVAFGVGLLLGVLVARR